MARKKLIKNLTIGVLVVVIGGYFIMSEIQNNNNNQTNLKDTLKKEWSDILYGQSARFRLIKYLILLPIFATVYWYTGGRETLKVLGILLIFSVLVHLFYRFKTNTWTKSWGGYKS